MKGLLIVSALVVEAREPRLTAVDEKKERSESRARLVILDQSEFSLDSKRFSSLAELRAELDLRVKMNARLAVLISGGKHQTFGLIVGVLDECRKAGITDIKVEGAPEKDKPDQAPQHNAGSRPYSGDSPASETTSSLGSRG